MANPIVPEIQGPINEEQQRFLAQPTPAEWISDTPEGQELITQRGKDVGVFVADNSYALVTSENENGEQVPIHFATLVHTDLGTTIDPSRAEELNLPSPAEAHETILAQNNEQH